MGQTLGLIRNVNLIILESSLDHTADLVAVKKQKLPTPNMKFCIPAVGYEHISY